MFLKLLCNAVFGRAAAGVVLASAVAAAAWSAPPASPAPPLSPAERQLMLQTLRADPVAAERVERLDDAGLAAAVVGYAERELGQRIRPSAVDSMWSIQPPRRNVPGELSAARAEGRLAGWLGALSPPFPQYRALQAAERRYAALAGAGGWAALPGKGRLRQGDRGASVAALRTRLAEEGYGSAASAAADRFDPQLKDALAAFQRRHSLPDDGVLGPETRRALDVSAEDRRAQIEANIERWRWVPRRLAPERVEIDIAGAQATLLKADQPALTMKVVVGDPRHHTPMFASRIDATVFNPPWKVPTSIATKEILPKAARSPGYLARNDFVYVNGRLTQRPGPKNSLGQVKFDLPSPFGVYLHDTPVKSAFTRPNRALSHGCMRLEKPRELAIELLAPQGWTPAMIDEAVAAGATRRIDLKTTVPLYVFYWTAVADPDGEVTFRPDVYGWDRKLMAALAPAPSLRAALPRTGTDCADAPK